MKKLFLAAVAVMMTALSVNAQVKIESPHPDLDIKITRCAFATGTVVIDMIITNFGIEEEIGMHRYYIDLYDDEGNSYTDKNSNFHMGFPNRGLEGGGDYKFPQDIPLKFRMQFSNISTNASKFSLVKIGLRSDGAMALNRDKPLVIRNLEWVK